MLTIKTITTNYKTEEAAAKVAAALATDEEDWTYVVEAHGPVFRVAVYDEDGEFVIFHGTPAH